MKYIVIGVACFIIGLVAVIAILRQLMKQQYLWTVRFVGGMEEIIKEELYL